MPSITAFNVAHLHLLLNHVPTVGTIVALGLLLVALARRHEALTHAGLEVLFVIAVVTLPVYTSGVAAQRQLRDRPGISDTAMRAHQDAALAGFTVTEFAGFVAWLALWQSKQRGREARGLVSVAILLTVVALALMAGAATLGGEIRHPEIRADLSPPGGTNEQDPPSELSDTAGGTEQFRTAAISEFMVNSPWAWPAAETLHFLGLSLSFGVLLAVNLRILGVMRHIAFADVHRLLPWGMLGFGVNLITGMLFFVGQPGQYIESVPFYWKVVFLMIAAANFLYLTVFKKAWADDRSDFGLADKAMAVSSMGVWLAVLYAGRMLPFIGNAF